MAPVNLYTSSIGLFIHGMEALIAILKKGKESPESESFPATKLYEDMLPLSFQVQITSNIAKKTVQRLTGREIEVWEDNEKTMDELIQRAQKTLDLLKSVDEKEIIGSENKMVELTLGKLGTINLEGSGYVYGYGLPNFFFHISMAYAIFRMKGVPLGKADYLTPFIAPYMPAQKA
ncbi:putative helix-turn-helix-domain-containing protein type protein [Diplogelasinospora grovesii]|uniref:Helix-turn-helix-domain-containing protein type protein n=1 Tax=Diplogelasinospora grovesii TaxID=303347 RepID=A0AAN6S418_9PEZI|nr:putative helix-turn-helix-domain-containing protein type protein [Diplogelasinospora grovesii]